MKVFATTVYYIYFDKKKRSVSEAPKQKAATPKTPKTPKSPPQVPTV